MADVVVHTSAELAHEVQKTVEDVRMLSVQGMERAVDASASELTKRTKQDSPRRTGVYARGWSQKKTTGAVGTYGKVVYNAKKPQLTHLLENGHEITGAAFFRKNKSRTDAIHHIPTDDETEAVVTKHFEAELEKELARI